MCSLPQWWVHREFMVDVYITLFYLLYTLPYNSHGLGGILWPAGGRRPAEETVSSSLAFYTRPEKDSVWEKLKASVFVECLKWLKKNVYKNNNILSLSKMTPDNNYHYSTLFYFILWLFYLGSLLSFHISLNILGVLYCGYWQRGYYAAVVGVRLWAFSYVIAWWY